MEIVRRPFPSHQSVCDGKILPRWRQKRAFRREFGDS